MAARRLLIVMLVLLGISTLAAALVPQSTLNDDSSTTRSTTTRAQATAAPEPSAGRSLTAQITVGPKRPAVVVAGPVCKKAKPRCEPIHVGDQLTLLVYSKPGGPLEFKEFGQFQFAAPNAAARFELLPRTPGRFGISFATTDRVAASVQILSAKKAREEIRSAAKRSKRRARGGSGRP